MENELKTEEWLVGKSLQELKRVAEEVGLKSFAGRQMADWIYKKRVAEVNEMTNLSLEARRRLREGGIVAGRIDPCEVQVSVDGTKKYLFQTRRGGYIEAVYIPDGERATLCVSSQAGCRMGCRFCMTGRQGFGHHLTAGEIVNQVLAIPEAERLTNIVFMGMGEPMDNIEEVLRAVEILTAEWGLGWSPTRITVSTVGVIPAMERLLRETKVHLAVSLHDPFREERRELMPVENRYGIEQVVEALRKQDFAHQRRLSFEYIVFKGVNDSKRHVEGLVRLLKGLACRINLIRFHAIPESPLRGVSPEEMKRMNGALNAAGILTTTRGSRGEDILAACGLLSTLAQEEGSK
ncbi:23S rRNA (adenine(2503)-C(2))-methyltransferase RlmN [uncultured Rikenella sp.]|uniref:23S rRNA (adenine(2503)-C(2))-methyltransferase RlmN n=1 Tax=uncultured Rikenella sp. TaxID=368003 RepID=UPI0026241485|nr:23S rRNA (adenine(2503)-C(2))-methyltransferase RlmN [uncultured Rikenella sp.]